MPRPSPRDIVISVRGWAGDDAGVGGLYLAGDPYDCPPNRLLAASNVNITPNGSIEVRRGCRPATHISRVRDPDDPSTSVYKYQIAAAAFDAPLQAWGDSKLVAVLYDYRVGGEGSQDYIQNVGGDENTYDYEFSHYVNDAPSISTWPGRTYIAWPRNNRPQPVLLRKEATPGTTELVDPAADSGAGWSEDFLTPKEGFFPPSNYIYLLDQGGLTYMLAASGGTLRWSHPSNEDYTTGSEAWREEDYTSIGTDRIGGIRAIAQFRDSLIVFKTDSIWALTGSFPGQVITNLIADNLGIVDHRAITTSRHGIWFFAASRGLYLWDGEKIVPVAVANLGSMETWRPGGGITQSTPVGETVSYWNEKIFVSGFTPPGILDQPTDPEERVRGSFVYDLRANTWTFVKYTMTGVLRDPNRLGRELFADRFVAYGSFLENEGGFFFYLPEMGDKSRWSKPGADDNYGEGSLGKSRDYIVEIQTGFAQAENLAERPRWRHTDLDGYLSNDVGDTFDTFEYEVFDKGLVRIVKGGPYVRPGFADRVSMVLRWKKPLPVRDILTGVSFRYWSGISKPS